MTYLLLQTFLLLLSAYFLGAFVACLFKRAMYSGRELEEAAVTAGATIAPSQPPLRATVKAAEPVAPRSFDPVQPKIDILPRPEPHAVPETADTSRFDRALVGTDAPAPVQVRPAFADTAPAATVDHLAAVLAANAKVARKSIVEIRPAILKPVTGPNPQPAPKPAPKPQPAPEVKPAPTPAPVAETKPAPQPAAPQPTAPQPTAPQAATPQQPATAAPAQQPMGSAAATAAAAASAAVAAARAAAAAAANRPAAATPSPAPSPAAQPAQVSVPVVTPVPKPQPAAQPAAVVAQEGDDDFLRIRAIDEDVDRRLKALGVRRFDQMARWTAADINRVNQALGFTDRIDREQWIEQAQILAKGGETYYSRNRAAAARPASAPQPAPAAAKPAAPPASPAPAPAPAASVQAAAPAAPSAPIGEPPRPMTPSQAAALAAAAAAAMPRTAAPAPTPAPAPAPATPAAAQVKPAAASPSLSTIVDTALSPKPERSVAELAAAAAAAIAAASASVTRGHRPIEPISPLSKVDRNIVIPARLTDAIKENEAKAAQGKSDAGQQRTVKPESQRGGADDAEGDDLKRIRGIGVLIEKRLNALGVTRYSEIANWTNADIDRISQQLDFKGRIERENWVEQARILSSGGQTEFSRRVDRGDVESSRDPEET